MSILTIQGITRILGPLCQKQETETLSHFSPHLAIVKEEHKPSNSDTLQKQEKTGSTSILECLLSSDYTVPLTPSGKDWEQWPSDLSEYICVIFKSLNFWPVKINTVSFLVLSFILPFYLDYDYVHFFKIKEMSIIYVKVGTWSHKCHNCTSELHSQWLFLAAKKCFGRQLRCGRKR